MASQKMVLVIGANDGIGYEVVKVFLEFDKAKYHVFLDSRSLEKGKLAIEKLHKEVSKTSNIVELLQVDVINDESIEKAFEQVKANPGHLDALVNNAGATFDIQYVANKVSLRDCFSKAYDVNVIGANVMTYTFMSLLLKSFDSRLIFVVGLSQIIVASQKYFPTSPLPVGWSKKVDFETIGYRSSKTTLNMVMLDWNHKMKEDGVKVWGLGLDFLATNLGDIKEKIAAMGDGHSNIGGRMIKDVVEGQRDGDVGKIVGKDSASKETLVPF